MSSQSIDAVKEQISDVFDDAFTHDGFSDIRIEMKILKRQQKEIIIHYGKQYRFVIDYNNSKATQVAPTSNHKLASIDN